jgi:hypothetical protein
MCTALDDNTLGVTCLPDSSKGKFHSLCRSLAEGISDNTFVEVPDMSDKKKRRKKKKKNK